MRADAMIDVLAPIAVAAENLKTYWKFIAPKPIEKGGAAPSYFLLQFPSVRRAVILDVIDSEEHLFIFAAARTSKAAVSLKDFVSDFLSALCFVD